MVDKKWCCVTDIMDHMITETSKVYEDTEYADNFVIFHDGLAAYWEKEAQDHLKDRGFYNRQLRAYSPTNDDNRYYKNRVVGDSPELCPSLDYSGFNDHHLSMNFHCALSVEYPRDELRAFRMTTPDEIERTMVRCWMMEPSSERICQDINLFPSTLQMIIDAQGCVLQDIDLRRGRRRDRVLNDPAYQKLKGEGQYKNKPRPRQRKETLEKVLRPVHPDCMDAYRILTANGGVVHVDIDEISESSADEDTDDGDCDSGNYGIFSISCNLNNKLE